jgi:hypothetical protein
VTVAGKARYLKAQKPENGIVMPQEYKQSVVEDRLSTDNTWKGKGWKTVNVEPHLVR